MPCLYVTDTLNIKVVSQDDRYYVNNNRVIVKCGGGTLCFGWVSLGESYVSGDTLWSASAW